VRWRFSTVVLGKKVPRSDAAGCGGGVQADWGPYEGLGVHRDEQGTVVFRGVRARVGMFHGEVIKVVPHSRTGERAGQIRQRSQTLLLAALRYAADVCRVDRPSI
jgi:hypothetical protein